MTRPLIHLAEVDLGRQRSPEHERGDHMVRYLRSANVGDGTVVLDDVKEMNFSPREQATFALRDGDVLVTEGSGSRETVGQSGVWREQLPGVVCFQNTLLRIRPRMGASDGRYLAWWARHAHASRLMATVASGANILHLSAEELRRLPVPDLGLATQRRIADFLDDQVARIDNIIASRRTQIDLVEEGLQGQIDRATSCGDRRRLAPLLDLLRDGTHTPPPRVDVGVPLLTAKNVKGHRVAFTASDTAISQADADVLDRSFVPRSGDVLLSVKGSVGNVAVVPVAFSRFQVERNLAVLRPARKALVSEWLYWCLRGRRVQDQIRLAMGFSAQPGVYLGDLASLIIEVPSIGTQASQAATLDAFRDSSASATTALESSIDLLSELKRSLITAAVTGAFEVSTADGSQVLR